MNIVKQRDFFSYLFLYLRIDRDFQNIREEPTMFPTILCLSFDFDYGIHLRRDFDLSTLEHVIVYGKKLVLRSKDKTPESHKTLSNMSKNFIKSTALGILNLKNSELIDRLPG